MNFTAKYRSWNCWFCKHNARSRFPSGMGCRQSGFSLLELMISMMVLSMVLSGVLVFFSTGIQNAEETRSLYTMMVEALNKMEEIRNLSFEEFVSIYGQQQTGGTVFTNDTLQHGKSVGVVYVTLLNPALAEVEIVINWQEGNECVFGEDTNLDGILDTGEDRNGNGKLDSPVSLATLIAKKSR